MLRNFLLLSMTLLVFAGHLNAQRNCAAHEVLLQQLQEDPGLLERMNDIERHTEQFIQNGGTLDRAVVTIPVVFHIVWKTTSENVSESQIATQLQVLNDDFRKLNSDIGLVPPEFAGIAADCEVQFCMAQQDPAGNPTNGIVRRQTTVTSFSSNNAVKYYSQGGSDIWDRDRYLNIWVCNLSSGLLGYAQFPGGASATDGVVVDYQAFGTNGSAQAPFDKGRTATHEVGHWLNLRHIWGDANCGNDQVTDTPVHNTANYGCPSYPHYSTCSGSPLEMTMNYMDYTDDACMYMFSAGQKSRMQAVLASGGSRYSLQSSNGCDAPGGGGSCGTPAGLSATSIGQTSATLNWGAVSGATAYNLQWKVSTSGTWTTVSNLSGTSYNLTGLSAGTTYNYQVQANCSGTTGNYSSAASFTTQSGGGGGCSDAYEANNSRSQAKVIPVNQAFTAQIATSNDKDWYRFSNTSSTRNIKIDLTTLPADYDVRLYRNSSQLAISQNAGTADEQIIYNTGTVSSSYYAYVYGYNGAFSSTECYTLQVSLSSSAWRTDGSTDGQVEEIEIPLVFEETGFVMFPNPASTELTIDVSLQADSDVQVALLDATGKIARQQHRSLSKGDNRMQLDINNLPNGMYFVQVRNGDELHTRKLVVQH